MLFVSLHQKSQLNHVVVCVCTAETWCLTTEVVSAAAHLTHWAWPAGCGTPQRWCCSPYAPLGTSSCRRPPLLPPWWSSCHRRPGAWGSGSEKGVVRPWTTGSSTRNWSLIPLCTAATHIRRGRCLTQEATRTRWPSESLQEDTDSIMDCWFSRLYTVGVCLLYLRVPLDEATRRTDAATPEKQRNDFTQTHTHTHFSLGPRTRPQLVPASLVTFWVQCV